MFSQLRLASMNDQDAIIQLIETSVRKLALNDYSPKQIELALKTAWGLDTQLIKDRTYFVIEDNDQIIGAGGWSYRKTLFGNDQENHRDPARLDPINEAAKIRAFFVHPHYARQGIGSLIMQECELAAIEMGFSRLELMSTLPGIPLYEHHGFIAGEAVEYALDQQINITFVPMTKQLS